MCNAIYIFSNYNIAYGVFIRPHKGYINKFSYCSNIIQVKCSRIIYWLIAKICTATMK